MWRPIVLSVVFSSCGFESKPAIGDDGPLPSDADMLPASDAMIDARPPGSGCFARWLDGTVALGAPARLMQLSANGTDERDPWVSKDGLRLYFVKQVTPQSGQADIYLGSRDDTQNELDHPTPVEGINTIDPESRASPSEDEKQITLSRATGGGRFEIYLAGRNPAGIFESPSKDHLDNINREAGELYDPFLTAGGDRLYLAPLAGTRQRIVVSTRAPGSEDFPIPVDVPNISDGVFSDADPSVADEDRILVFSSFRSGAGKQGTNLWYATRDDPAQPFGRPKPIPTVNSDANDGDPMLSFNGCELYFASKAALDRNDYDLYVAKVVDVASSMSAQR